MESWDFVPTVRCLTLSSRPSAVTATDSENELAEEEGYEHISVLSPISQLATLHSLRKSCGADPLSRFLMPQLNHLKASLVPSRTDEGDGISAIIIAIHMITTYCKKLKYIKNIYLVTNGTGNFDTDGVDEITSQIKAQNISLTVLGVDFDDAEYGYKEEGKSKTRAENEKVLEGLCEAVDGVFGTLEQAVAEMGKPRLKTVRPVASYKGKLILGDEENYHTAFSIDVERYPRTMVAKPVSASRYAPGDQDTGGESSGTMLEDRGGKPELQTVRQARSYQVENEEEAGGMMEIDKEEMAKGYKYGRTVVPISQTDEEVATYPTEPSMRIVGFIPASNVSRVSVFRVSSANECSLV